MYVGQYFTREFTFEKDQLSKKFVSIMSVDQLYLEHISKQWSNDIKVLSSI